MIRAVFVFSSVLAAASTAAAEPALAYVDEIAVAGGPNATRGREFAETLLRRAGLRPRFADPGTAPCGDNVACLADRARGLHAAIALRLTIAEVGDRIIVVMLAIDTHRTTRREIAENVDLSGADETLATALRDLGAAQRPERRLTAWSLASGAVGVAGVAAGGYFAWRARSEWNQITQLSADRGTWDDHYASVQSDAIRSEHLATVLVVVGAAGIATGAVLWYLGGRRDREQPMLIVAPSRGGAEASMAWRF